MLSGQILELEKLSAGASAFFTYEKKKKTVYWAHGIIHIIPGRCVKTWILLIFFAIITMIVDTG